MACHQARFSRPKQGFDIATWRLVDFVTTCGATYNNEFSDDRTKVRAEWHKQWLVRRRLESVELLEWSFRRLGFVPPPMTTILAGGSP